MSFCASAQLKVGNIFGDYMVLQRDKPIHIWGWNDAYENVIINYAGQSYATITNADGNWSIKLNAQSANKTGSVLIIKDNDESVKFSDVLIGEVWLCSGQSNMEWKVGDSDNAEAELKKANKYPNIRHIEIPKAISFQKEKDFDAREWKVSSFETAGGFTAVGYFMAQKLSDELDVPIGLVHSTRGGSHVETWISKEGMLSFDLFKKYAQEMPNDTESGSKVWIKNVISKFHSGNKEFDISKIEESDYLKAEYDFTDWTDFYPMGQWDWKGVGGWRGSVFIQKDIEISTDEASQPSEINFGALSGDISFYINGELVNSGFHPENIKVNLQPNVWKAGTNRLLVKFSENSSPMSSRGVGLFGNPADFNVTIGGEIKPLMKKSWKTRPSWASPWHFTSWMNNAGTITFNAMIAPLVGLSMQGAIWYQGESNASGAKDYQTAFPLMIKDWHRLWEEDFPFLWVQLAAFGPFNDGNLGLDWGELREAQSMTLSLSKTGQAVIIDNTTPYNIHPTNKQFVGERMALAALKVAYNKDIVHSGPSYESMPVKKGKVTLTFRNIGSGLKTTNKYDNLEGFEIAGSDKKFYFAKSEIVENTVVVSHGSVKSPVAVGYGLSNAPLDANLINKGVYQLLLSEQIHGKELRKKLILSESKCCKKEYL
jgi:sialate O-acetylesterase